MKYYSKFYSYFQIKLVFIVLAELKLLCVCYKYFKYYFEFKEISAILPHRTDDYNAYHLILITLFILPCYIIL